MMTVPMQADYTRLWTRLAIKPASLPAAVRQAKAIIARKEDYLQAERKTKVPWFVIGALHGREAGYPLDFRAVLHNGERIIGTGRKTRLVPAGRGPFTDWVTAAYDALVTVEQLDKVSWTENDGVAQAAYAMEKFNGFGYRRRGLPSPYLWGGTSVQRHGKYVRDGVFDPNAWDSQIGGMAVLRCIMNLDPSAKFGVPPLQTLMDAPTAIEMGPTPINPRHAAAATAVAGAVIVAAATTFGWYWGLAALLAVAAGVAVLVYRSKKRGPQSPKTEKEPL